MGAWGPALFSDDMACDVRDQCRALIEDGIGDDQVTGRVLECFAEELSDPDEGPVVLLALAVTQSRWGRLDPGVAGRALRVIADGAGLSRWREQGPALLARRHAALETARVQLTGPQPPRRRLPSRRMTSLQPGDVLAYRTLQDRFLLLRVVRIHRGEPIIVPLDFAGDVVPPVPQIARIADRLFTSRRRHPAQGGQPAEVHEMRHVVLLQMQVYKKVDYPQAGYVLAGNIGPRPGDEQLDPAHAMPIDWQDYLPGYRIISQLLPQQARPGRPRPHLSHRRAPMPAAGAVQTGLPAAVPARLVTRSRAPAARSAAGGQPGLGQDPAAGLRRPDHTEHHPTGGMSGCV